MRVSAIIPSRGRFDRLLKTLNSIYPLVPREGLETLIKFDDDDIESINRRMELIHFPYCRDFVWRRGSGWKGLDKEVLRGLEIIASGDWIWPLNDDMIVEGDWYAELLKVPTCGYIVQPEFSRLGESLYERAEGQAFPIIPRNCWRGHSPEIPTPFDTEIDKLLRVELGWKTWFLKGVTMHHQRDNDAELERQRL